MHADAKATNLVVQNEPMEVRDLFSYGSFYVKSSPRKS